MSCGDCTDCTNKCNVCENCDSSHNNCNTQQTFCSGSHMSGQLASAYVGSANAPTVSRDDIIIEKFPRKTMNDLISYLNTAAKYGDSVISTSNQIDKETRDFIYADKINEIIDEITTISSSNSPPSKVKKDDVCFASFFNSLFGAINDLELSNEACDDCNSACNTTCLTCNSCNSCISCNTCQHVSSYSVYYSNYSS